MITKGRILVACGIALLMLCVDGSVSTNFTTNQIISSHDYPQPYPVGVDETWVWRRDTGLWGIKFIDVDLTEPDTLIIQDGDKTPIYVYKDHSRLDTTGPVLRITFQSGKSTERRGRGFRLDIRYGVNTRDLDKVFLEANPPPPTQSSPGRNLSTILPILLGIATIALLLFLAVVSWFLCQRRRRRQQQEVSLSVNVEGGIRRGSGVRYTRKPSTQSQLEDPPSPRKMSNLVRSNSNRSWMVRAELSATTSPSSTTNGRCNGSSNGNGTTHAVQNVYTPMESDTVQVQGKVSVDLQGQGQCEKSVFRSRIPTLEKVPEDQLLTRVPVAALQVSQDDGYMGPNPKSPASSYLNCPISESDEVAKFQSSPATARCEASYQNITVTGRVGIV